MFRGHVAVAGSVPDALGQARPGDEPIKKNNQLYLRTKADTGTDSGSGSVHGGTGPAANVGDVKQADALLHGQKEEAFGDDGYTGVNNRAGLVWRVAMKAGERPTLGTSVLGGYWKCSSC
jgi:IS5 family transposase